MSKRKTWIDLKQEALKVGATPLFKYARYRHNLEKFKYSCNQCKHEWFTKASSIQSGRGCPECAVGKRAETRIALHHTLGELKAKAKERGGKCVSKKYLGVDKKHDFVCSNQHKWSAIAYNIFTEKSWCPVCSGRYDKTTEMRALASDRGGKLLSTKYIGLNRKYDWQCNLGHRFSSNFSKIRSGRWCSECSDRLYERLCRYMMEQLFSGTFPSIRPKWLNGLELDGYNGDLKIAFEHQGFHHYQNSKWKRKGETYKSWRKRDLKKAQICRARGVVLIPIPELTTRLPIRDLEAYIRKYSRQKNIGFMLSVKSPDLNKAYIQYDKIQTLNAELKEKQIECIDKTYLGIDSKHNFKCKKCSSIFSTTVYGAKKMSGCPICRIGLGRNLKKTMKDIELEAKKANLRPDFKYKAYSKNSERYKYICLSCNRSLIRQASQVQQGKGCGSCTKSKKFEVHARKMLQRVFIAARKKNGKCLSSKYTNIDAKLDFECEEKHLFKLSPYNLLQKKVWCAKCGFISSSKKRLTPYKLVQKAAQRQGFEILSESGEYKNGKSKLKIRCQNCNKTQFKSATNLKNAVCSNCHRKNQD